MGGNLSLGSLTEFYQVVNVRRWFVLTEDEDAFEQFLKRLLANKGRIIVSPGMEHICSYSQILLSTLQPHLGFSGHFGHLNHLSATILETPNSPQARSTRMAISPLLATKTFWSIFLPSVGQENSPYFLNQDSYSGIFPCFLGGLLCRLFWSISRALMSRGRVSWGSMTSSM